MNKVALYPPVASAFATVIEGDLAGIARRGDGCSDRLPFASYRKPGKPFDKGIDVGEFLLMLRWAATNRCSTFCRRPPDRIRAGVANQLCVPCQGRAAALPLPCCAASVRVRPSGSSANRRTARRPAAAHGSENQRAHRYGRTAYAPSNRLAKTVCMSRRPSAIR